MTELRSICVYCGSRTGPDSSYTLMAQQLGRIMAESEISLVYGGGTVGLMGVLSKELQSHGGHVIGIIPEHLDRVEIGNREAAEYHVVKDMHTRKKMMFERSDAFVVLPGGLGTLEEMFEVITWAQLGLHQKPIVVCNHDGYWSRFAELVDHCVDMGFASVSARSLFTVADDIEHILPLIRERQAAVRERREERPDLI